MKASGKKIVTIEEGAELTDNAIYQSRFGETRGVVDILRFINAKMRP